MCSEVIWNGALVQMCVCVGGHRSKLLVLPQLPSYPSSFLRVAWHQMDSLSEEQLKSLMSPSETLCGDVKEAPHYVHVTPSGGWRYTGLGRAVKLPSTVVLPPSTAGSAHVCGPKEAKGRVTSPSIAIKHASLPQRMEFLYSIGLDWANST